MIKKIFDFYYANYGQFIELMKDVFASPLMQKGRRERQHRSLFLGRVRKMAPKSGTEGRLGISITRVVTSHLRAKRL